MPARKRAASTTFESPRRSRRIISSSSAAAAQSKYFENDSDGTEEADEVDHVDHVDHVDQTDQADDVPSGRRQPKAPATAATPGRRKAPAARLTRRDGKSGAKKHARAAESDPADGEDEEKQGRKKKTDGNCIKQTDGNKKVKSTRGASKKTVTAKGDDEQGEEDSDGSEHHEEQDKGEGEDSDGERKVTVIPLEQLRPDGGVEYADDRLHKNTLLFLQDLKKNNKRSWLKSHDGEYRRSLKDWQTYVESFSPRLIGIDDTIPELPVKDLIFRVYRDTRFSKDPVPYKPYYSAAWSRTGRKGPYACYYIHVEPGSCFVGGGLWGPDSGALAALRQSIYDRPDRWEEALSDAALTREFLPGAAGPKRSADTARNVFAQVNREGALKKGPTGYRLEHRCIELLKLKNFTIRKKIDDGLFVDDEGQERIASMFAALAGFVAFLNGVVMPDLNVDDEDEGDEGEDGNEED